MLALGCTPTLRHLFGGLILLSSHAHRQKPVACRTSGTPGLGIFQSHVAKGDDILTSVLNRCESLASRIAGCNGGFPGA